MPRHCTTASPPRAAALLADLRRRAPADPAAAWLLRVLTRGERAAGGDGQGRLKDRQEGPG
jgi:hypothetical protein